jgi:hypothetical protein
MPRSYSYRPVQPIADLETKFGNDFEPTEATRPLSANSSYSSASKQLDMMDLDPTLDMNSDQEDPDLTPTAANPRLLWAQESGVSLVADLPSKILQRRSFDDP